MTLATVGPRSARILAALLIAAIAGTALIVLSIISFRGTAPVATGSTRTATSPTGSQTRGPTSSAAPTSTSPRLRYQVARDRARDTRGPDLRALRGAVLARRFVVRADLATPITDRLLLSIDLDTDSDVGTGSLTLPCNTATVGADYRIVYTPTRTTHVYPFSGSGCQAPLSRRAAGVVQTRVSGTSVIFVVDLAALQVHGPPRIELFASAQVASGPGQIDYCPGQGYEPLSVSS